MIKFDVIKVESKIYFGKKWYEVVLLAGDWRVGKAEFKGNRESWRAAFGRAREIARRKLG